MEDALVLSNRIHRPLLAAAFLLTTLLTGTTGGELVPGVRVIGAVIGAFFVITWIRSIRRWSDRVDLLSTVALILFAVSAVLAVFPRQAFDASMQALAWVAAFGVARRALDDDGTRRYALMVLASTGIVLTIAFLALWGSIWIRWLALTGWQSVPPLDLPLPSGPWAHQHDLTVLLVVFAPAIWLRRGAGFRRLLAIAPIAGVAALVLMDGSRSVWLALAASTALVAARPALRLLQDRRIMAAFAVGLVVLAAAAMATGVGDELLRRATNLHTLSARTSQWEPALAFVSDRPVQGAGPGSYAFLLRLTDYFATNEYVSRHPDNGLVQLIVEGGVLGLAAAGLVMAAVVRHWRGAGSESRAATWALVFAVFAGIGTNPFDYAFLIAPILVWAALGAPASVDSGASKAEQTGQARVLRGALAALVAIAGAATAATLMAGLIFQSGSEATRNGEFGAARDSFRLAAALDPGMALYRREAGVAALELGDWQEAVQELEGAAALNPADDVARRILAESYVRTGDLSSALEAAQAAVTLDASAIANLGMLARVAHEVGATDLAEEAVTGMLLHAPLMGADPAWTTFLGYQPDVPSAMSRAVAAWQSGNAPWMSGLRPAWLVGLAGRQDLSDVAAAQADDQAATAAAVILLLDCATQSEAIAAIRLSEQTQRVRHEYWFPRLLAEEMAGDAVDQRLASTANLRDPSLARILDDSVPTADFFSGRFKDQFGYRRAPAVHPTWYPVPTIWRAMSEWLHRTKDAAASYELGAAARCGRSVR